MILTAINGKIEYYKSLTEAFFIEKKSVVSIIGAGGKTSLIFALADELLTLGSVFITTSTHMYAELGCIFTGNSKDIIQALKENGFALAGVLDCNSDGREKIKCLDKSELDKCINYSDFTLIEADGARHMKIKFPRENEPVIVPQTNKIILVMNIGAVGERTKEVCFNYNDHIKEKADVDMVIDCIKKYQEKGIDFSVLINGIKSEKNKADFLYISSAFPHLRFVGTDILRGEKIEY